MTLSKKQIIYGSVLAVAGIAWVIDAAFFGPPPAAHAANVASDGAAATGTKQGPAEALIVDGPEHLLTTRLQKWAIDHSTPLSEMSDVFQPPAVTKPVVEKLLSRIQPAEDPALAFNRRHRLLAIVLDGTGGYALIDGRVLRVGQAIDDAKLIGLTRRQARFSAAGRLFDVALTPDVPPDR